MLKRRTKKIVTTILSICMILSMVIVYTPYSVFAGEPSSACLKFSADNLDHGRIFYQIGSGEKLELNAEAADGGGAIWINDIESNDQTIEITAEPESGYVLSDIRVYEGEDESASAAYNGNFDRANSKYSFPVAMNINYVVEVIFNEEGAGGEGPGGEGPETAQAPSLKFSASDMSDLDFSYKIDLPLGAIVPEGDHTSYGTLVAVDAAEADEGGGIWVRDFIGGSKVTIQATLKPGVDGTLEDIINSVEAMEGDNPEAAPAYNGEFSFNSDRSVASYTFVASQNVCYAVRVDYIGEGGSTPPGEPGPGSRPENYGNMGYISVYTHNDATGKIYYAFATDKVSINPEDWNELSVENNFYAPIAMSEASSADKLFVRIEGRNGKHIDVDGRLLVTQEGDGINGPKRLYSINGTYNDDPNYDIDREGAQLDGIGISDLYDNVNDNYVIPIPLNWENVSSKALTIEFQWIDVTTITVSVDDASQYMISGDKAEIGIATGKGFKAKIEDGCCVSIPSLPDYDFGGDEERFLIDIKVKREYFIPEFSFNGNRYETFEVGNIDGSELGTDEYAYIATAIPAREFKNLLLSSDNNLTIHLTVDKSVGVTDSQGHETGVQAAYRMIDDGEIPETTTVESLDANMTLEADSTEVTAEAAENGIVEAYEIGMEIDGHTETEFAVPINIMIPGEYNDDGVFKVVREHDGEPTQELECVVEDGNIIFSTDKFSRFSIKCLDPGHSHHGIKVAQVNATCKANGVNAYYKCDCGKFFKDAACTDEIIDLAAWKSGEGAIAKKAHTTTSTTTKATLTANGKIVTKCTVCGTITKTTVLYAVKTITLSSTKYTYDGKEKKPSVTVKDSKGNTISTSYYTVAYSAGRKNVGKYTVKVTFKGRYSGSKSLTYVINPPKTAISKLSAGKKAFTVTWTKKSTQVTGYQIQYSTSSSFASGNKTVTVTSYKTISKTIKSLVAKKKYYVRVRTYRTVGGTKYYSAWSAVKSVTTKK